VRLLALAISIILQSSNTSSIAGDAGAWGLEWDSGTDDLSLGVPPLPTASSRSLPTGGGGYNSVSHEPSVEGVIHCFISRIDRKKETGAGREVERGGWKVGCTREKDRQEYTCNPGGAICSVEPGGA